MLFRSAPRPCTPVPPDLAHLCPPTCDSAAVSAPSTPVACETTSGKTKSATEAAVVCGHSSAGPAAPGPCVHPRQQGRPPLPPAPPRPFRGARLAGNPSDPWGQARWALSPSAVRRALRLESRAPPATCSLGPSLSPHSARALSQQAGGRARHGAPARLSALGVQQEGRGALSCLDFPPSGVAGRNHPVRPQKPTPGPPAAGAARVRGFLPGPAPAVQLHPWVH